MKSTRDSTEDNRRSLRRRLCHPVSSIALHNTEGNSTVSGSDIESSNQDKPESAVISPCEGHPVSLAPLSMVTVDNIHATIAHQSPVEASPTGMSPHFGLNTQQSARKLRSSGEVIDRKRQFKRMKTGTSQAQQDVVFGMHPADGPEWAVPSPALRSNTFREAYVHQELSPSQTNVNRVRTDTTWSVRMSTRHTTTTTGWSPSRADVQEQVSGSNVSRHSKAARSRHSSAVNRPIANATRDITFAMLQPHFERPLQQAADSFGVCTTLLKKICRRNGIRNWPHRKIGGLRKSIASMAKQVEHFDGEQRRTYANQLQKLKCELRAYLCTGNEPTQEFLQTLEVETIADQQREDAVGVNSKTEGVQAIPLWSTRTSLEAHHDSRSLEAHRDSSARVVHDPMPRLSPRTMDNRDRTCLHPHGLKLQVPVCETHQRVLPSIASILQHQSYSSPSRAASTPSLGTFTASASQHYERNSDQQEPEWRYFPPVHDDAE
ncbi:unnamed protein product [Hyaloperonospora brassicae]|uniref:RWP-RK domain-containing protein n=1 Tax=Hyaloperonospora brassicae TaxID=162125 RepID=A0AAV0UM68_HYABA|nr:unnamed protein product [Hyaloperonospora brassicae]